MAASSKPSSLPRGGFSHHQEPGSAPASASSNPSGSTSGPAKAHRSAESSRAAGIRESCKDLESIVAEEVALLGGGKTECVFLAGISQGCALAILHLFTQQASATPYAGFIALSSWLPFQTEIEECVGESEATVRAQVRGLFDAPERAPSPEREETSPAPLHTPVLIAHCDDDKVVPVENGESFARCLRALGMKVRWERYKEGGHWLNEPAGVDDLVDFIRSCMVEHWA